MKIYIFLLVILCNSLITYPQGNLRGVVTDENKQPLPGVTIYIESLHRGAVTNGDGTYELTGLETGNQQVSYRMVGMQTISQTVLIESGTTTTHHIVLKDDVNKLDEIVVSASRNSEFISEIPASVTVIDPGQLLDYTKITTNINEILEFAVPGLALGSGTFSNWGQTLRGRSLLVMVDGIPQSTPLRNGLLGIKSVNPNDISRVEVIKGATSIFGNGGNGGFINYITKSGGGVKPLEGSTNMWGTSNLANTTDAQGWGMYQSLRGQISRFSYYLSGSYERTGNQYDAKGVPLLPTYGTDNTELYSTFFKMNYQLSDKQQLSVNGNLYQTAQHSPFIPELAQVEVRNAEGDYLLIPGYGVEGSVPGQQPTGTELINSRIKYEADDLFSGTTHFETDIYFQKTKNVFFYSRSFENGGQSVINAGKYGIRPNLSTELNKGEKIKVNLTYGLDMLRDKTNQGLLDGRLWVPDIEMFNWAPYLQSTFRLYDDWVLKAGLRYDGMQMNIDDYQTLPYSPKEDGNYNPSVAVEGGKLRFNNIAYNFGVRFIQHDEFIPYVSYSQGFSVADLGSILRSAVAPSINDINLEPAVTNNYEFGFMAKFPHVRLEAVAFYSTSNLGTGVVFQDETNSFVPSRQPQDIFGGELSIDAVLANEKLQTGISYSYVEGLKSSISTKNDLSYLGGDVIAPAKMTTYVTWKPLEKLSTTVRFIHQGDRERFAPFQDANGKWNYRHTEFPVEGYNLFNLAMDYQLQEDLSLSLAVRNLFNAYYLPARSQWAAPLRTFSTVGEGINCRLGLQFQF